MRDFVTLSLLEPTSSASCFVKAKRCLHRVVLAQESAAGSVHISNTAVQQQQISKGTRMVLRAHCSHCAQGGREVEYLQFLKRMTIALTGSGTYLFLFPTNILERVQSLLPERGPGMQAKTLAEQLPLPQDDLWQPAHPPTPTCSPRDKMILILLRGKILPGPAPAVIYGFPLPCSPPRSPNAAQAKAFIN